MSETLKFNNEEIKENWATNAFKEELKNLEKSVDKKTEIKEIQMSVVKDFLSNNKDKNRSYWISAEGNNEGRSGKIVTAAQIALKEFGFNPGSIDGKLGPKTNGALNKFKELAKITEEGIGSITIQKVIENIGATKENKITRNGDTPRLGENKRTETANQNIEKEKIKIINNEKKEDDLTKKESAKQNEFFDVIVDTIEKKGLLNNEKNLKSILSKKYGEKNTVLEYLKDKKITLSNTNINPDLNIRITDKNNTRTENISIDTKISMKGGKFNEELLIKLIHQKLEKKVYTEIETKKNLEIYEKQNKVVNEIKKMSKKYTIDNLGFSEEDKESLSLQRIFKDFSNGEIEFNHIAKDNLAYGKESKTVQIKIDIKNSLYYYPTTRKFEDICDESGNLNEKKLKEKLKNDIKGLAKRYYEA